MTPYVRADDVYTWTGQGQDAARDQFRRLEEIRAGRAGMYMGRLAMQPDWVTARPDAALLVLGPPRKGKTSGLVIPNVLAWPGPVISTSVKPDVLEATVTTRSQLGRCWLFDPAGTSTLPRTANLGYAEIALPEVERLRWSPAVGCESWDVAHRIAARLVRVAKTAKSLSEGAFWSERSAALLAPLLHAAALDGRGIRAVAEWVRRRAAADATDILREHTSDVGAEIAADTLHGILSGNDRELMSHWSTADSALSAYRSAAALASADEVNFEPRTFHNTHDTIYITAAGAAQEDVAPIIVAFLEELREATFAADPRSHARVLWALDEIANIAPIPDLPKIASQAGGQGIALMACMQDLTQARQLWEQQADGLLTLFQEKVVFGGIADTDTLERMSLLVGEQDVTVDSTSESQGQFGPMRSVQQSKQRRRRLPVSAIGSQMDDTALAFHGAQFEHVIVFPYFRWTPWRELAAGPAYEERLKAEVERLREAGTRRVLEWLAVIVYEADAPSGSEAVLLRALLNGAVNEQEQGAASDGKSDISAMIQSLVATRLLDRGSIPGHYILSTLTILWLSKRCPNSTVIFFFDEGAAIHGWLYKEALEEVLRSGWQRIDVTDQAAKIVVDALYASERQKAGNPTGSEAAREAMFRYARGDSTALESTIETLRGRRTDAAPDDAKLDDGFKSWWRGLGAGVRWAVRYDSASGRVPPERSALVATYAEHALARWPKRFWIGCMVALALAGLSISGGSDVASSLLTWLVLWTIVSLLHRQAAARTLKRMRESEPQRSDAG
jgi:type IV secretion system protein VirD4